MTPFERRMGAITKASAEIFLGDVQGGFVRLLEAMSVAFQKSGWGQMVAFGTLSAGIAHVLAGRIDRGIRLLENAVAPRMRAVKSSTLRSISFLSRKCYWKC